MIQELLARASASISDGDVLMSAVRRHQVRPLIGARAVVPGSQLTPFIPAAVVALAARAYRGLHRAGCNHAVRSVRPLSRDMHSSAVNATWCHHLAAAAVRFSASFLASATTTDSLPGWCVDAQCVPIVAALCHACSARRARTRRRASRSGCCLSCSRTRSCLAPAPPIGAQVVEQRHSARFSLISCVPLTQVVCA